MHAVFSTVIHLFHIGTHHAVTPHVWMTLHCGGRWYSTVWGWPSGPDMACVTNTIVN